jgi:WhiB family redox-sensing transcriptional regulator
MTKPLSTFDPDWRDHAACKGENPAVFFFEDTSPNHEARRMCYTCPVRIDCLEYATENEKDWGVWAGVTARVRLTLRRLMLKTNTSSVLDLLATKPDAVLSMYPAPRRVYRRNPDKPSPISTNEMVQALIEAARIRYLSQRNAEPKRPADRS